MVIGNKHLAEILQPKSFRAFGIWPRSKQRCVHCADGCARYSRDIPSDSSLMQGLPYADLVRSLGPATGEDEA